MLTLPIDHRVVSPGDGDGQKGSPTSRSPTSRSPRSLALGNPGAHLFSLAFDHSAAEEGVVAERTHVRKVSVKNTFIDVEDDDSGSDSEMDMLAVKSDPVHMHHLEVKLPRRESLLRALHEDFQAERHAEEEEQAVQVERSQARKVSVKNTFIDVSDEDTGDEIGMLGTKSLPAHMHHLEIGLPQKEQELSHSTMDATPTPYHTSEVAQFRLPPDDAGRLLLGQALDLDHASSPSTGSKLHGMLDDEGLPACSPCAWFWKAGGCQNGAECRRCHLCPEGESKARKKQKQARLKAASQANAGNAPSTSPVSEQHQLLVPAASETGRVDVGSPMFIPLDPLKGVSVKNTFIDVDSEDDDGEELADLPLHQLGAKTCTARLSEETDSFSLDSDLPALPDKAVSWPLQPQRAAFDATPTPHYESNVTGFGMLPVSPAGVAPQQVIAQQLEAQSCTARLSQGVDSFGSPTVSLPPRAFKSMPAVIRWADATPTPLHENITQGFGMPSAPAVITSMPPATGSQLPSVGSALHGQIDAEGLPRCEPCAWFYKSGGCSNGAECKRCHLCPEGETKARKKSKNARLKAANAAAAQGETLPQNESPQNTAPKMAEPLSVQGLGGVKAPLPAAGYMANVPRWFQSPLQAPAMLPMFIPVQTAQGGLPQFA
eukprot:TRINITY_DN2782_c0_g1_i1.p1 TRINITY_DN2782_c0_g1~~TRINITY_DN2782_c0_g1_i1.p1  ORF type:complete len:659 (+),score=122.44 TRINITY_DN2782_c0_g1_i1:27-2003(+)